MPQLSNEKTQSQGCNRGNFRSHFHLGHKSKGELLCPKPRRVASTIISTDVCRPLTLRPWRSMPIEFSDGGEAGDEILGIFLSKKHTGEIPGFGCSPPYFSGSPPHRAGNPVVRDKEFSHPKRPLPAPTEAAQAKGNVTKSSSPTSPLVHPLPAVTAPQAKGPAPGPSFRPSPSVRIEGFECSGRGFECTGRDMRQRVAAFA